MHVDPLFNLLDNPEDYVLELKRDAYRWLYAASDARRAKSPMAQHFFNEALRITRILLAK